MAAAALQAHIVLPTAKLRVLAPDCKLHSDEDHAYGPGKIQVGFNNLCTTGIRWEVSLAASMRMRTGRGRVVCAAAGETLDLLVDLAAKPSEWHAPDLWKESLGNLSAAAASSPQLTHDYCVAKIGGMLRSMGDGNISVSAYDTAWVAMVPALDGSGKPQFPGSVDWVLQHQLSDGSWGEPGRFCTYDRVLATIASVVALATWGIGAPNVNTGCAFIAENMDRIGGEPEQHMPVSFEMLFPALLKDAKKLGLDLPYHSVTCNQLLLEREHKLTKIDLESLHTHPSSLLHSLEGLGDVVDWGRILELQSDDGSFLSSPASTACALIHTGDPKCLRYLESVLERFDDAAPTVYPVDMIQRLWIVDRLQRLGIGRHFQEGIKICLDHVYDKYWKKAEEGATFQDLGTTAMAFRLLRLHGYPVSADVFLPFKRGDGFVGFDDHGQRAEAVFNLYRASETLFPGETVLEQARAFSRSFLVEEKWQTEDLSKDLAGEVEHALAHPFTASMPRIGTRAYIDQYGSDDIRIGKSLYSLSGIDPEAAAVDMNRNVFACTPRMADVHNPTFLALAQADFNLCQRQYQEDLEHLVRWNAEQQIAELDFARQKVVESLFAGAAIMYEPELSSARRVWTQGGVLNTVVDDYFDTGTPIDELRQFMAACDVWDPSLIDSNNHRQRITFMAVYNTVNAMAADAHIAQGRDVSKHLRDIYTRCFAAFLAEAEAAHKRIIPSWEDYVAIGEASIAGDATCIPPMFFVGEELSDAVLESEEFKRLRWNVNLIGRLMNDIQGYKREAAEGKANSVVVYMRDHPGKTEAEAEGHLRRLVDSMMQQVTEDVFQPSPLPRACKMLFFHMATCLRMFYKDTDAYSSLTAMKEHVTRLLFQPVACS